VTLQVVGVAELNMSWKILKEFKNRRTYVEVVCDCGSIEIRRKDHVLSGRTKSCKRCSVMQTLKNFPNERFGPRNHEGVGDISKTLWNAYKFGAKKRGIPFEITLGDAWKIFLNQKGRCALSGEIITLKHGYKKSNVDWKGFTASLDRIDSSLGYVTGNIQWVHEDVNYIKRDLSEIDFICWCTKIAERNKGK
jgi:hypothetical protein